MSVLNLFAFLDFFATIPTASIARRHQVMLLGEATLPVPQVRSAAHAISGIAILFPVSPCYFRHRRAA
jgi:hypothetical protein